MKQIIILLILVTMLSVLGADTAAQILAGRNVIAYIVRGQLNFMDIDTGKEVPVPTVSGSTDLTWDKTGQSLYRINADVEPDQAYFDFTLYRIDLPSLQETELTQQQIEQTVYDGLAVRAGIDGNIYVIALKHGFSRSGVKIEVRQDVLGAYNPLINSYKGADSYPSSPPISNPYASSTISRRSTEISNQLVNDGDFQHFELFQHPANSIGTDYVRLTNFGDPIDGINLYERQIDFAWSPDHSRLLYSYHYYTNDQSEEFEYTCATDASGSPQVYLTSPTGINAPHAFVWTPDGRLIFSRGAASPQSVQKLSVLGKDWQIKDLKTLGAENYPAIYYRY